MPAQFVAGPAGMPCHTMTAGDAGICLDHAAAVDPHRGPDWMEAFAHKARQLGYAWYEHTPCRCNRNAPHSPECGLVKSESLSRVWPHDHTDDPRDGILNVDRLPSPMNPFAGPPIETIVRAQSEPLPRIPEGAVYTGGVVESDPDRSLMS